MTRAAEIEVIAPVSGRAEQILTPKALAFVGELHRELNPVRQRLLAARVERQARLDAGEMPDFLAETRGIREGVWQVARPPADLHDRRVEITGPVDRKMVINALNSGARVFMADFEDATTPSWENLIEGHANLIDAIERTIEFANPDGRTYRLNNDVATLFVRPRGWHLPEKHLLVDGEPVSGSLFDFGLYVYHNGRRLLDKGSGPYFYLPKLESHHEARLWNDAFLFAQDRLDLSRGSIRATVLVETILAAFEMEEILFELREHSAGLNAGRWDYIFSMIKKFRTRPEFVLPDRTQVTMTVPFMRAYTELLVKTCHARGAHAIGGMAAFIPSRRDAAVNDLALTNVQADKQREAGAGFDGTWVAHPDLVSTAMTAFDAALGDKANQVERRRDDVRTVASELLDVRIDGGVVTEAGVRTNVGVAIQYLESWLRGVGAAAINNLMEDAATAEISRSQIWQWIRHGVRLDDGRPVSRDLVRQIQAEEMQRFAAGTAGDPATAARYRVAAALFEEVALSEGFAEFLTIPAYERID
ncbi:MAG: malate synthase A [Dehalococcoidia bacterium]